MTAHTHTPRISIVLPTYNGARWLAQSIQSVIDQTFSDWELIIVNDASTDNTAQIATEFAAHDKRIHLINNLQNKKLPASLNTGFAIARGKYRTWTSDDNFFMPNALETMAKYLDTHPDTDMVSMNMDYIDEQDNFLYTHSDVFRFVRNAAYLLHACNVGAAFMYRTDIANKIGEYDTNTFCAEDYDYWCRIALSGNIDYTNDNIYKYRTNPNSLSATRQKQVTEKTRIIQRKYAPMFFKKFKYTYRDRAQFYANTKQWGGIKYAPLVALFRMRKIIANIAALPLFWWPNAKRAIRNRINRNDKYSFSQPKA